MATSHPYISGPNNIKEMIIRLRSHFPKNVASELVQQPVTALTNNHKLRQCAGRIWR